MHWEVPPRAGRLAVVVCGLLAVLVLMYSTNKSGAPTTPALLLDLNHSINDTTPTETTPDNPTPTTSSSSSSPPRRNLLLVYFDDMRPDLNAAYSRKHALTPNLDALATNPHTVTFSRAFANYPMCSPSRTSTLYGRRAVDTHVMTNMDSLSPTINPSLFKHLQHTGKYYTANGGKIFHSKSGRGNLGDRCWNLTFAPNIEQTQSWCNNDHQARSLHFPTPPNKIVSPLICITKGDANKIADFKLVNSAVKAIKHVAKHRLYPFALAVGLYKPHFPLHVHDDFFQPAKLNDAENHRAPFPRSSFPYTNLSYAEDGSSIFGLHTSRTSRTGDFSMFSTPPRAFREMVRKSYGAGISQSDHVFGQLVRAMKQNMPKEVVHNTLIVVLGDHGFGLGEKNLWAKDALYDVTLRVPLLMHAPWISSNSSSGGGGVVKRSSALVELVDVYRTVSALVGVPVPADSPVDGEDMSQEVRRAIQGGDSTPVPLKDHVFAVVARCGQYTTCTKGETRLTAIGFSIRTEEYRYTVWMRGSRTSITWDEEEEGGGALLPSPGAIAHELYSHADDAKTLLQFDGSASSSFDVESENLADKLPDMCRLLYRKIREKFDK